MKVLKPQLQAYFALVGIWLVLSIGYALLAFSKPGHNLQIGFGICVSIVLLWSIWLHGFYLRINSERLEYRDGFYRRFIILKSEIRKASITWIEWGASRNGYKIPCLVIIYGEPPKRLIINCKLFERYRLAELVDDLEAQK